MHIPRRRFLSFAGARRRLRHHAENRKGTIISCTSDTPHRRLSTRRPQRHSRAPDGAMAVRPTGSAGHRREPARRLRQYRHRGRRARAGRRVYAPSGRAGERHQPLDLRQSQSQFPARHRAGRGDHARATRHAGPPLGSRKNRFGVHRLCEGEPGQGQDGIDRERKFASRVRPAVQDDGGGRHCRRALRRRRTCAERHDRRPGAGHVRTDVGIDRAHQERQAARAGGDDGDAFGRVAGNPELWASPSRATKRAR